MTQATTQGTSIRTPTTPAELRQVHVQRNELASQLLQVSDQRSQLVGERHGLVVNQAPANLIAEVDARLKTLGERIVRIERDKLAADDAIAQALARGVSIDGEPGVPAPPIEVPLPEVPGVPFPGYPGDLSVAIQDAQEAARLEYVRISAVSATGLLLLGVLLWRWAWGRAAAKLRRELAATPPSGQRELRDAVDAIALEVERISENQRFVTKLLAEKGQGEAQAPAAKPR